MTVLSSTTPTARKQHRCEWCYTTIKAGQKYHRQACLYDDRVYDWVSCIDCIALANTVSAYWGHPDEGINEDSFRDWAADNPDDARATAWLARFGEATA